MDLRTQLKNLIEEKELTLGYIASSTGIARSTISMWLNGVYTGNVDKVNDKINNFIKKEHSRSNNTEIPFCDISISKYITEIGRLCHTKGSIGVCVGKAGLGKTVAVKNYANEFMDSILIESDSGYTAKSMLLEIHKRLGLSGNGSVYSLMDEVVNKLNNSGRLLIIDEAENLPYRALELARRIHDKAGVGVLLVGRNILYENLRGFNNQYDQLYSRVRYYKMLDKLKIQDVKKILIAANQNTSLVETYFQYSEGNTRMLEHLISHSTDIAKNNGMSEVDSALIKETSKLLMRSGR